MKSWWDDMPEPAFAWRFTQCIAYVEIALIKSDGG